MSKYLDIEGVKTLWTAVQTADNSVKSVINGLELSYDSENRTINLRGNKVGENYLLNTSFNASDFVKDGMIKEVRIIKASDIPGGITHEGTLYNDSTKFIEFTWNSDVDANPDTEGMQTKVTRLKVDEIAPTYKESDTIGITGDNTLYVQGVSADITRTKDAIPVAGGPLAKLLNDKGIYSIDANTNFQELLFSLFCEEQWPSPEATYSVDALTSTLSKPSTTMPSQDGKCVKIGTTVSLNKVSAANAVANTPKIKFDNFTYGFATERGKTTAATTETNPSSVTATVTTNDVTYTLTKTYSGFGKTTADNTSATGADASALSFDAETVTVALGGNKITYKLSVDGQVHSATVAAPSVYYALSNLGNTDKDDAAVQVVDATTSRTLNPSPAKPDDASNTDLYIYGVYPVYNNAGPAQNLESLENEVIGTDANQLTFEVTYKNDATTPCRFAFPGDRTATVQLWNPTFSTWGDVDAANSSFVESSALVVNNVKYSVWTYAGNRFNGEAKFKFTLSKKISA